MINIRKIRQGQTIYRVSYGRGHAPIIEKIFIFKLGPLHYYPGLSSAGIISIADKNKIAQQSLIPSKLKMMAIIGRDMKKYFPETDISNYFYTHKGARLSLKNKRRFLYMIDEFWSYSQLSKILHEFPHLK